MFLKETCQYLLNPTVSGLKSGYGIFHKHYYYLYSGWRRWLGMGDSLPLSPSPPPPPLLHLLPLLLPPPPAPPSPPPPPHGTERAMRKEGRRMGGGGWDWGRGRRGAAVE